MLLTWRNDPAVRQASLTTATVTAAEHRRWLEAVLADPTRHLFIAEEDGVPVGTVRADARDGARDNAHVLSWTVAPTARGRGIGKHIVALLASRLPGPVRAEVKSDNPASARIARAAGLTFEWEADGVLHFARAGKRPTTDRLPPSSP